MKTSAFPLAVFGLGLLATLLSALPSRAQALSGVEDPAFPAASREISVTPGKVHTVTDLQRGPDGSVWLTGLIGDDVTAPQPVVTRLHSTGQIDTAYGTSGTAFLPALNSLLGISPHTMSVLPDGRVVVAFGDKGKLRVRRLTAQGQQDVTFGNPAAGESSVTELDSFYSITASAIIVQPDGKLLILAEADRRYNYSLNTTAHLFRLNSDGSVDTTFATSGRALNSHLLSSRRASSAMTLRPNGDIWVATANRETKGYLKLARLKSDGSADTTFGTNGVLDGPPLPLTSITRIKMEPSGGMWVTGLGLNNYEALLHVLPDGSVDPAFNTSLHPNAPSPSPYDFVQARDGRVFVAGRGWTPSGLFTMNPVITVLGIPDSPSGQTTVYNGTASYIVSGVLMSLRPDGATEPLVTPGTKNYVMAAQPFKGGLRKILLEDDGSLLVAGDSGREVGVPRSFGVTRYLTGTPRVYVPPVITETPGDFVMELNASASVPVRTATNVLDPTFFWRKDGVLVATTHGDLYFPRASLSDAGEYTVEVRNFAGSDTKSFRLIVKAAPRLSSDLTASVQGPDLRLSFSVTGRPPFAFQWQRSGSDYGAPQISPTGAGTLTVPATPDYTGDYLVVVTNEDGSLTSKIFSFSPPPPYPIITQQPVGLEGLAQPGFGSLSVEASGQLPLTFQWQKDGVNVGPAQVKRDYLSSKPGHVSSTLKFLPVDNPQPADSGNYRCIISNAAGWTSTQEVSVRIYDQSMVRLQQQRQIVRMGEALTFSALPFVKGEILSAFWLHNGRKIPGVTDPTEYQVPSVDLVHAGTYQLALDTADGKLMSEVCTVAVVDGAERLAITTTGKSISLAAPTAGPGLAFAWRRIDGQPLAAPAYSGAQTATLKINNPGANEATTYVCDISWAAYYGPTITSGPVVLQLATHPPELESAELPTGQMLMRYEHALQAAHQPHKFTVTGLPRGLSCDPRTGIISGKPLQSGTFTLRIVVANMIGASSPVTRMLAIAPLPEFIAGSYRCLVSDLNTPDMGVLQLEVTSNGQVTGKMTFQQPDKPIKVINISTKLEFENDSRLSGRSTKFRLPEDVPTAVVFRGECELQLLWDKTGGNWSALTGRLVNAENSISFTLDKRLFTAARPTTAHAGYSTMIGNSTAFSAAEVGNGISTVRVSPAGDIVFIARMPGSGTFTAASFLVADPYSIESGRTRSCLYAWTGGTAHRLFGWISSITNDPSEFFVADMTWIHGGEGHKTTSASINPLHDGFTAPVRFVGSLYMPPPSAAATIFHVPSPARISAQLFAENLPGNSWTTAGTLGTNHVLTFDASQPDDPLKLTRLTFNPATGIFTGEGVRRIFDIDSGALLSSHPATFIGVTMGITQEDTVPARVTSAAGFYTYPYSQSTTSTTTGKTQVNPLTQSGSIFLDLAP